MLIIYFYFPTVHNGRWVFLKKRLLIRNCLSKMLLFLICNFYFIFF
nr:MAG TPA: hypothetical protein [Caudoviricetes sp.]